MRWPRSPSSGQFDGGDGAPGTDPGITRAQAKNLVLRSVSALTGTPPGRQGRPSRSMTLAQATAVTAAARAAGPRTRADVMLSLCTGMRTEEARAPRWEHVDFGDPRQRPAAARQRGGVAVGAGPGRHQDQGFPGHPRPPAARGATALCLEKYSSEMKRHATGRVVIRSPNRRTLR